MPDPPGGNSLAGMSTLAFGAHAFRLAIAVDRAAGTPCKNGLRPSGVLTLEKFLTIEQRDLIEKKLVEKFMGRMNARRPLVLEAAQAGHSAASTPKTRRC